MASPASSFDSIQFGAPMGDYRGSVARIVVLILGFVVLAFGAFITALAGYGMANPDANQTDPLTGVILGVIFILVSAFPFGVAYVWRGAHAQLFERGFIIARAGKTTSAHWEDVTSITQRIVQSRYYGIPVWTSHRYDITLANGEKLRVNDAFGKASKLGDAIQRMSANALLPRAIASYQSGATLPFGKLSVSQVGISNGKETLPWADLSQVALQNGYALVMRKGKMLRWTSARISQTPNVYVLLALVGFVQRGGAS
ncbi:MAG TPA: DUF6585 family protein [Ktedonobacterales bacterium]|jgi:hypothetical protein|nr:DUF6585 family protein [Ktedonobacterales bacterium]